MRAFRPIAPGWLSGLGLAIVIIGAVVLWLILRPSPTGPQGTPGVNGSPGPSTVVTPPPASPFVLVIPSGQTTKVTTTPTTRPTPSPSSHVTSTPRPTPTPTRTPPPSPSPTPRPSLICVLGHCPI